MLNVDLLPGQDAARSVESRTDRHALREGAQRLYAGSAAFGWGNVGPGGPVPCPALVAAKRLFHCGRSVVGGGQGVSIVVAAEGGSHFAGLQTCGSVWACPVCQAKIRQHRAGEIQAGAERAAAIALGAVFVTLTVSHHRGEGLAGILGIVAGCWRAVRQSTGYRALVDLYGVNQWVPATAKRPAHTARTLHAVRSLEITYGANGWHPHLHLLIFTRCPLGPAAVDDLDGKLRAGWDAAVVAAGWRPPHRVHGVDVQVVDLAAKGGADVAKYLAKVLDGDGRERGLHLELTRHDLKVGRAGKGRSPLEVLAAALDGDRHASTLWAEYVVATKGRQAITFTAGFRTFFGLGAPSTDDEIAEAEAAAGEMIPVEGAVWSLLCSVAGARAELLRTADYFGAAAVRATLAELAAALHPPG